MSMEQQSSQARGGQSSHVGSSGDRKSTPGYSQGGTTRPPVSPPASGSAPGIQAGVQSVAEDAQQKVGQTVDQVRERGMSQLANQKDQVAGKVGSVAHALREMGKQLKQSNDAPIAEYVDRVADSVEQFSNHLRQRRVDELIEETESFARRQPALFLGGAFFLGLVAARFLKSSRPEPSQVSIDYGSPTGSPRGVSGTGPFSWQDDPNQPRQAQLPALPRPPLEPPRMGSGSSSSSTGPRSS